MPGFVVVGTWALAGACLGTGVGAVLLMEGAIPSLVPVALGLALANGAIGAVAHGLERRAAGQRAPMLDRRGRLVRPTAPWLMGVPLVMGALGLLGLVVVSSVYRGSAVPGLLFLLLAVGLGSLLRPLVAAHWLVRAVAEVEQGHTASARRALQGLAGSWLATGGVRRVAALNLGLLAVREGSLDEAARWYEAAAGVKRHALALAGLALVRVLQERYGEAEALLRDAEATEGRRAARSEIDGVRMLVVLRRDGAEDARVLGERLRGPGAGGLLLGLLAVARARTGDEKGARELADAPGVRALLATGLPAAVTELREIEPPAA